MLQLARAGMVSLKYAYFTRADLAALGLGSNGSSLGDQLLVAWATPTLRSVHRNVFATALSRRIDTGPNSFSFFVPSPPEAPRVQLDAVHKALETGSAEMDAQTSDLCRLHLGQGEWGPEGPHAVGQGRVRISAIWVMARIILRGCRDALRPWPFRSPPMPVGFLLSLPFAVYPQVYVYTALAGHLATRPDGSTYVPVGIVALLVAQAALIWVLLGIQYAFLVSGVIDYTRRALMVRQLDGLVSERHYVSETERSADDVASRRRRSTRVSEELQAGDGAHRLFKAARGSTVVSDRKLGGVRPSREDGGESYGEGIAEPRRPYGSEVPGDDMSDDGGVSEPLADPMAELNPESSGPEEEAGPSFASQRFRLRDLARAKLRDDATLQETYYTVGARRPVRRRQGATLALDSMQNMQTWLHCRWMLLHFGHHFLARIQVNSSLALSLAFLLLLLVFLLLFLRLSVDFLLHLIVRPWSPRLAHMHSARNPPLWPAPDAINRTPRSLPQVYLVITTNGLLVLMVRAGAQANESTNDALEILLHREWRLTIALQRLRQLGDLAQSRTRVLMDHLDDESLGSGKLKGCTRLDVARDPTLLLVRARKLFSVNAAGTDGGLPWAAGPSSGAGADAQSSDSPRDPVDKWSDCVGRATLARAAKLQVMNFMQDETVWALSKGNIGCHSQLEQHVDEVRQQLDAVRWTAGQVRTAASVEPLRILGIPASTGVLSSIATIAGTGIFVVARQVLGGTSS